MAIPDWAPELGKRLVKRWHKADADGRKIECSMSLLVPRLASIVKMQPLYSPAILEAAAEDYLKSTRKRYKAPQFFFTLTPDPNSDGKPPFQDWADSRLYAASPKLITGDGE